MARRLLTQERLAWIQQVTVEHATYSGDLQFNAEADAKRFHGSARFDLRHTMVVVSVGSRASW